VWWHVNVLRLCVLKKKRVGKCRIWHGQTLKHILEFVNPRHVPSEEKKNKNWHCLSRELAQAMQCPVCLDAFSDPRHLPCGHSLCLGCATNLAAKRPMQCRKVHKGVEDAETLPRNFALAHALEALAKAGAKPPTSGRSRMESGQCFNAAACKAPGAVLFCKVCLVYMCEPCAQREHSSLVNKHHEVVAAKDVAEGDFCMAHRLPMLMFCASCRLLVCSTCALMVPRPRQGHKPQAHGHQGGGQGAAQCALRCGAGAAEGVRRGNVYRVGDAVDVL
jgi:hypothetical protein